MLLSFNNCRFSEGRDQAADLRATLAAAKQQDAAGADFLNDLFVLDRYVDFLATYGETWQAVIDKRFSDSWVHLQDALDLLRVIKKFSDIDVAFFEDQLIELENAYPYAMFSSVGMTVSWFKCSLCGQDIDADDCPHIRGELYSGEMAQAVAQDVIGLSHVSLLKNPDDKRCVISYGDETAPPFNIIRYVSDLVASGTARISDFRGLVFSKRTIPNPEYVELDSSKPCFCGSGVRFDECCVSKASVEIDHVDVTTDPADIGSAVV